MPIAHIYFKGERSLGQKRVLVGEVAKTICKSLDVSSSKVQIILPEMVP